MHNESHMYVYCVYCVQYICMYVCMYVEYLYIIVCLLYVLSVGTYLYKIIKIIIISLHYSLFILFYIFYFYSSTTYQCL